MVPDKHNIEKQLERAVAILERIADRFSAAIPEPDWSAPAYLWHSLGQVAYLQPVPDPYVARLGDLLGIDDQKALLERNTRQFVQGLPANNALLWGARGTGKSSLVKALLGEFRGQGLRLVEVGRQDLHQLPDIVRQLQMRQEHYVIFTDDLSFESDDASYKHLKALLDGSVAAPPENILVYATSNRRHLVPEYMNENLEARLVNGEIHHGETVEEKISLSERFGLWLSFYPFDQDTYLAITEHWLSYYGLTLTGEAREEALRYALSRGSRSGRVANQFARGWTGRQRVR